MVYALRTELQWNKFGKRNSGEIVTGVITVHRCMSFEHAVGPITLANIEES